jgi:hypothetical protein
MYEINVIWLLKIIANLKQVSSKKLQYMMFCKRSGITYQIYCSFDELK